jgi:hypothetical protein
MTVIPLPPPRIRRAIQPLVLARLMLLTTVARLILLGWGLPFVLEGAPEGDWVFLVLVGAGLYSLGAIWWLGSRPLNGSTAQGLRSSYEAQFVLRLGLASVPALLGLGGAFITNRFLMFLVGGSFTVVGLAVIAPSRRNIERAQEKLVVQGSRLSLGNVLTELLP